MVRRGDLSFGDAASPGGLMPGRSPSEAVAAFLEPIQIAVSCIGIAKVTLSPKGRSELGQTHLLTLNGGVPVLLSNGHGLDVRLQYEIVRSAASAAQPFRVTTRAYLHAIKAPDGRELISAHWHPTGNSAEHEPHWHIGAAALADDGVFSPRAHIPSPRVSIENLVGMCITQFGCRPQKDDWEELLTRSDADFRNHRSWPSGSPDSRLR